MTLGFLGDIHGDISSLKRAVDALLDCSSIYCVGDVAGNSDTDQCIKVLTESRISTVMGNHDFWAIRQARSRGCPAEGTEWLEELPLSYQVGPGTLMLHSFFETNGSNDIDWFDVVTDQQVADLFDRWPDQSVIVCGHTHLPCVFEETDAGWKFHSARSLRGGPVRLEPAKKYLVNAGRVDQCVVKLLTHEDKARTVVYTFF